MQKEELIVTDVEAAKMLKNPGFLGRFVDPASPSDVARALDMPANLAHHHAKRALDAGLLFEALREHGKVYYQLAARTFKHDMALLPVGDPDERMTATVENLGRRFLTAYERSLRVAQGLQEPGEPDYAHYGFGSRDLEPVLPVAPDAESAEKHPAHYSSRTLRLTPEGYRRLVRGLARLLNDAEREASEGAGVCTVALLAFGGPLSPGSEDGRDVSSFVRPDLP